MSKINKLNINYNSAGERKSEVFLENLKKEISAIGINDKAHMITDSDALILMANYKSYPVIPIENKGYFVVDGPKGKEKKSYYVSHAAEWFEITGRHDDKDGKCKVWVKLRNKVVKLPQDIFIPSEIEKLVGYGIHLNPDVSKLTSKGFINLLHSYEVIPENRLIGFRIEDGKPVFDAYDLENPMLVYSDKTDLKTYIGSLNNLVNNAGVMFALACACASLFLAFLRIFCNIPLSSFVIAFVGKTSTGKSTVQTLMASVYTKPSDEMVLRSFYGTENALIKLLDNKMGVPMIFDETTITGKTDIGRIIYAVSLGRGKARCTTNSEIKQSGEWYTIVSTSSESSNFTEAKVHNGGFDSRNIEFENIAFTDSAEHADQIKAFSSTYYGVLGKKLSEYLVSVNPDSISQRYTECKEKLSSAIGQEKYIDITDRLIANYALILLAAVILKEFGVRMDVDAVTEIITDNHSHIAEEANIAEKAYRHIVDYIASHPFELSIQKELKDPNVRAVIATNFEKILTDFGVTNIRLVTKRLEEAGYLIRGKGSKLTPEAKNKGMKSNTALKARRRFGGVLTDCYLVKLPDDDVNADNETEDSGLANTDDGNTLEHYEEVI